MNRGGTVLAATLLLLGFLTGPSLPTSPGTGFGVWRLPAFAAQKTASQLEAEYDREGNPKKRLGLAVDLMEERLKQVLAAFESEEPEKENEAAEMYLAAADRLEKAMGENSNLGAVKSAEIRLRRQSKSLTDLSIMLSAAERPPVEKLLTRVNHLHERLLDSIMRPRK